MGFPRFSHGFMVVPWFSHGFSGPRCSGPAALAFVGRRHGHGAHGAAPGDAAGAARDAGLGGSQQSTGGPWGWEASKNAGFMVVKADE